MLTRNLRMETTGYQKSKTSRKKKQHIFLLFFSVIKTPLLQAKDSVTAIDGILDHVQLNFSPHYSFCFRAFC